MRLNTLSPAFGSTKTKKRAGRGIGCTLGKTCGRGHKGQRSRSGGYHMIGFEGGQMPFQRRIPKFGFRSRKALVTAEVNLSEINSMPQEIVDMTALYAANIISGKIKRVKVIASGTISRKIQLQGIKATKGALAAIEAAGGAVSQG